MRSYTKVSDSIQINKRPFLGAVSQGKAPFFNLKNSLAPNVQMNGGFKPWPGQKGTDVGRQTQGGNVTKGRVQRTDDPRYKQAKPLLLEFNKASCLLTNTMEIKFIPAKNAKRRLPQNRFNKLKQRVLNVANKDLNGWIKINAGGQNCNIGCKTINVKVIAKEGNGPGASPVELVSGSGRANAELIHEGDSNVTLWHETSHIVLGTPDEYDEKGRPKNRVNESDWSVMASSSSYGRRAVMHPRHFNHLKAWLSRRFRTCSFTTKGLFKRYVADVNIGAMFGVGRLGGQTGFNVSAEVLAGLPIDKRRRLRVLLGGYATYFRGMPTQYGEGNYNAFMTGIIAGMDASVNRSKGHFGGRLDLRLGLGNLNLTNVTTPNRVANRWVPLVGGGLTLGYQSPNFEAGLRGVVGAPVAGPNAGNPYYMLGFALGGSF
jgi:hypothetical protein